MGRRGRPRRSGAAVGALRLATHNVRGLDPASASAKLGKIMDLWRRMQLDVVFVQEHHVIDLVYYVKRKLLRAGWTCFWSFDNVGGSGPAGGRARRGTMVAVRTTLVTSGRLQLKQLPHVAPGRDNGRDDGRMVLLEADWAGHKMLWACPYMPNAAADQKRFIEERLEPLKALAGSRKLVVAGDFNFVEHPSLDRLQRRTAPAMGEPSVAAAVGDSTSVGRVWRDNMGGLEDVWRVQHPTGKQMTWFGSAGAARLDRVYVDTGVADRVRAVWTTGGRGAAGVLSDHCPAVVDLTPLVSQRTSSSRRHPRLRITFADAADLRPEMATWLAAQLEAVPSGAQARLRWFARLKKRLRWRVLKLNGVLRARTQLADTGEAAARMQELLEVAEGDDGAAASAALGEIIEVRAAGAAAAAATEAVRNILKRRAWVHGKERPNPGLTERVRPRASVGITALRAPDGSLATAPGACAKVIITHWAEISRAPNTTTVAQAAVLGAMQRQGSPTLGSERAVPLGENDMAVEEVLKALGRSNPGAAPGADGIPVVLYKKFKTEFAPILARVFSAVGAAGAAPRGFLDGVISVIHKGGSRLEPGNYRPISLTNIDYRLLARVLAARLGAVLPDLVDPAQTAFVRGRSIGENVMLLQCLPAALAEEGSTALVAFCDFKKAYDTIDRGFLLKVAEQMGLGAGFVRWVRLLLTDTRSAACVGGCVGPPRKFFAGVRQGCPLAPLLYLLIGQALVCWLRDQGLGVEVGGVRHVGMQYADDLKALLEGPQQVGDFLAAMEVFGEASGQRLNPTKTQLLPVGACVAGFPQQVEGLAVVTEASALGLKFAAFSGEVRADWDELMKQVGNRLRTIKGCNLSIFGRAFAVNAYALSQLLYHAEFAGLPPQGHLDKLQRAVAALVDRKQAPWSGWPGPRQGPPPPRRFAGVAAVNLVGRPEQGGLGLMPLREHVLARQARWMTQLMAGDAAVPWIAVGRQVLSTALERGRPHYLPRMALLAAPRPRAVVGGGGWADWAISAVPPVLGRMMEAVLALPRVEALVARVPGPWCHGAPLWGNPHLANEVGGLEIQDAGALVRACRMTTVGDALKALAVVRGCASQQEYALAGPDLFGPYGWRLIPEKWRADELLKELLNALPRPWFTAALSAATAHSEGGAAPPAVGAVEEELLAGLGWKMGRQVIKLETYRVKVGTQLIMLQQDRAQHQLLTEFAAIVGPGLSATNVLHVLGRMWQLPWENKDRAVLWRLVINGMPTA